MNSSRILNVSKKELASYFSSPVAFVFLGTFLLITLFSFFWVERFFARNIADVRPLFEWLPLLLIFLVAALTMRMWSEERRAGTVEFLLTLPLRSSELVFGKLLACIGLVLLALVLTLPLPLGVSFLGELDWGPVIGGYVATLFLAGSYAAIGLWVSSRTDSQIVALIGTVLLCLVLYLVGSDALTAFFGTRSTEILQLLSPASRFDSITRGVLDVRDLYFYLSLIGIFFALNVYSLEKLRWQGSTGSAGGSQARPRLWKSITLLLCLNLIAVNFWLHAVRQVRIDLTADDAFSISDTTRSYLSQLSEPLLIRGYFSSRTHPLLAPLVPQMRDLMQEFEIVSDGKVRVEFVDPRDDEALEEEANRKYGIKPLPFQIADRHQASVVSSYFDVLVEYGDKFEILSFRDLIEVKAGSETQVDVRLRNPEYDLTRSIKKVLYGFQGIEHLFQNLSEPLRFTGYISQDQLLPDDLREFKNQLKEELAQLSKESNGKFTFDFVSPDQSVAQEIDEKYGFQPLIANLLDPTPFYFYMVLEDSAGSISESLPIPADLTRESFRRSLEATLKRFSPGFLKRIGLMVPVAAPSNPMMRQFGMDDQGRTFSLLRSKLGETYTVQDIPPGTGTIPGDIDLLMVLGPQDLSARDAFAIDQFLMRGGTAIIAKSPFEITRSANSLNAREAKSGLEDLLAHYGIRIGQKFVLDTQNDVYAMPVTRTTRSGFSINEVALVRYPYFVDIRGKGINPDLSIFSGVPSVTMNWPSPIELLGKDNTNLTITPLLESSPNSWVSDSTAIGLVGGPETAEFIRPVGEQGPRSLGVLVEGQFTSFFADKDHPLRESPKPENVGDEQEEGSTSSTPLTSLIERSSGSPRLIVLSSADFVADATLQLAAGIGNTSFVNSVQLIEDAIDWSLEDRALLSIRGRGQFARTLVPMDAEAQKQFEYMQYILALLGLSLLFGFSHLVRRARYQTFLNRGYQGV
jgi:ABC-2 type transport system permease protein